MGKETGLNDVRNALFGLNNNQNNEVSNDKESRLVEVWLDEKYLHKKTKLNGNQVIVLTIISSLAEKYKIKCLKAIVKKFVMYKISEGGESAKQLVDILKNRPEIQTEDNLIKAIEPFIR